MISLTGLGISFTQIVLALAQNSLILALVLTPLAGIVLGMGMPTTPAYIVMVSLLVPALIKLGVEVPAAHMFVFYFAVLSAITPPVALAVFAAAGARQGQHVDARAGRRCASPPPASSCPSCSSTSRRCSLSATGAPSRSPATAAVGVMAWRPPSTAISSRRWWLLQRLTLVVAAFLLIKPGIVTDAMGLALLGAVAAMQWFAGRRTAPRPPEERA